jgi:AcrR family transcriptional regulator
MARTKDRSTEAEARAKGGRARPPLRLQPRGATPPPPQRPGPAGGPRDRNRKERIQALGDAALRLFLERGLEGVTIDDITQACGVAKGTFYRYFNDKESLVGALVAPVRAELVEGFAACGRALASARDFEAQFAAYRALGAIFARVMLTSAGVVRLFLQESRGPAFGARTHLVELSGLISRQAVVLTEKARTHGLLREVRAEVSALLVVGAIERLMLAVFREEEIGNPLELPDLVASIVLDGLRAK